MYSLLGRVNYIIYNAMIALMIAGSINHMTERWGHLIGTRDTPIGLKTNDVKFELREVN